MFDACCCCCCCCLHLFFLLYAVRLLLQLHRYKHTNIHASFLHDLYRMKVSERRLGYIRQLDKHGQHTDSLHHLSQNGKYTKSSTQIAVNLPYHISYRPCNHHHEFSAFQLLIYRCRLARYSKNWKYYSDLISSPRHSRPSRF